jgi:hypothetical protein
MTEQEMTTIAAAIRLLSNLGMLDIVIGNHVQPAQLYQSNYGPLTFTENKKTGEFFYLLADSSIPVKLDELFFTMRILS